MRTILKIAKTELQVLFYSPVAWLILVIFTFQSAIIFTGLFDDMVRRGSLGWPLPNATLNTFGGMRGFFTLIQTYLFLYIPLLTMNIMSREYATESIKLLYSSPITNYQIILGKYLSIVVYALALIFVLLIFGTFAIFTIDQADAPLIFSGLLGFFLLICAYGAIGLFMSSITSYTVVAAMGTLGILALLNYVKGMWQDIELVRDITYWLAISGRSDTFISGLLTSEDIIYFLSVIVLFIGFTIVKLQSGRQKSPAYVNIMKYVGIFVVIALVGYFSSKPSLMSYYDTTRTKQNTLTAASQEIVAQLDGPLTINTYSNMLERNYHWAMPVNYKRDVERFQHYLRFKPDIKINHYYYYHKADYPHLDERYPDLNDKQRLDTLRKLQNWKFPIVAYDELEKGVRLDSENFRFTREIVRGSGERTFLRVFDDIYVHPFEAEISAAFKRLTLGALPTVGFVRGNGERESESKQDRGYNMVAQEKTFRYSLINQGFDFTDVDLANGIPDHVRMLVIAEPRIPYSDAQMQELDNYIAKGGNLLIAGEPEKHEAINEITKKIGVEFLPGILVKPSEVLQPDLILLTPTAAGLEFSHHLDMMKRRRQVMTMPGASALSYTTDKGFDVNVLFTSDSTGSWREIETTNFIDDSVTIDPHLGEIEQPYPTVLALSRQLGNQEQRIVVTGDADWLSNTELGMSRKDVNASNFSLINAAFYWLSNEEVPVNMNRDTPPDRALKLDNDSWGISKIFLKWIFPALLILIGLLIWIRRRGR